MKTDILSKISNVEDYLAELVYNLNGDFPDCKFILNDEYDTYRIIVSNLEVYESAKFLELELDITDAFVKKFPSIGLYFIHH